MPIVLAVGETVRQAAYGLALGLTSPVLPAPPERAAPPAPAPTPAAGMG